LVKLLFEQFDIVYFHQSVSRYPSFAKTLSQLKIL